MIDLYIENYRADIKEDISALITFAIDDVKQFGKRNTAFSKTIILPGTAANNNLFGNIFDFNSSNDYDATQPNIKYNFNAGKSARSIIFQDNIQIFKGVIRLLKITIDNGIEYEVSVTGELGGLAAALGAKKLEELDFSEYNNLFNVTNITASWNTINGSGVYYPFIDYANMSTNKKDWDIRTFRPALYAKEYINKIFTASGYNLISPVLDTNRFRSLIVTSTRKDSANTNVNNSFSGDYVKDVYENPFRSTTLDLNQSPSVNFFQMLGGQQLKWIQGTGYTTSHAISLGLKVNRNIDNSSFKIQLDFFKNGVSINSTYQTLANGGTGGQDINYLQYYLNTTTATTTDDVFYLAIKIVDFSGSVSSAIIDITVGINSYTVYNTPAFPFSGSIGGTLDLNASIPKNILQIDFLSSIAKLFNLLIYEAPDQDKLLIMEPYVTYYDIGGGVRLLKINDDDILLINDSGDGLLLDDGQRNVIDWTYKMDRSKPIELIPMSELNARYFYFQYKHDADYWNEWYFNKYNENYGDFRFDSEFEFSKDIETAEVIFASTPLVKYDGDDKVMPAIYKLNGNLGAAGTTESIFEGAIRILQAKKKNCAAYAIMDGATTLASGSVYGYAGHFDDPNTPGADLNFGATRELFYATTATSNNQFSLYWLAYMAEIINKDSKLLKATFRLTTRDINGLDFSKLIYIDGALFRLNKIEDYNATTEDTCKVTLLKVIQTTY